MLKETINDSEVVSRDMLSFLNKSIIMYGYYISMKRSKTKQGNYVYFGTFEDREGAIIDTVDFVGKYPWKFSRGVYRIAGIVRVEYGYITLEINEMERVIEGEDIRYN